VEKYRAKSTVVSAVVADVDVFSISSDEKEAVVNYMKVVNGAVLQSQNLEVKKKLDESDAEILLYAVTEMRNRFSSHSPEIIVPLPLEYELPGILQTVPQRGDKKQLLELSHRNAVTHRLEKQKQKDLVDPERHGQRVMARLQSDLRLKELPRHIECFDNSNFQGDYPVAAMVVYKNAKPEKKEYRHFNIKTVEGPNDFASMEEVVFRRYKRLLEEDRPLPQLIIVDGGKGQLSSALESLEKLGLRGRISIIGIAKRLEEIYFPGDSLPLYIDKKSDSLRLIQQMRDEAHRFGITHHRKRRDEGTLKTELTEIKGIGPVVAEKLLTHYKSVKKIKELDADELTKILGPAKARLVFQYFHS